MLKISSLLAAIAVFCACGEMADILPSAGTYKVSANVNGISLDDCSLVSSKDKIMPFFEEAVSGDPDVTALVVFLKNSRGEITGVTVTYKLADDFIGITVFEETEEEIEAEEILEDKDEQEKQINKEESKTTGENEETASTSTLEKVSDKKLPKEEVYKIGDELLFTVKSLDKNLPFYPLAVGLPMDRYSIVCQVMGGDQILQKIEKSFFYLADTTFSFNGIQAHFPGVTENTMLIPKETVIMLDAKLDYDGQFEPYIVWYDGKTIISEGKISDGAGSILWHSPEQSGFFSLRAEVFPFLNRYGMAGFSKDVSLLVSSNTSKMHLLSVDTPGLTHWYIFEGNLNDSAVSSEGLAFKPAEKVLPKWLAADDIYTLATESGDFYLLEGIPFSNEEVNNWRILFRFKPVEKGEHFRVNFGASSDVSMVLSTDEKNLVLTLSSSAGTVSQKIELPPPDQFITAAIDFSILAEQLLAKLFVMDNSAIIKPIKLEASVDKEFKIVLGNSVKVTDEKETEKKAVQKPVVSALWDEFAIINLPLVEEIKEDTENEIPETVEAVETVELRNDSVLES